MEFGKTAVSSDVQQQVQLLTVLMSSHIQTLRALLMGLLLMWFMGNTPLFHHSVHSIALLRNKAVVAVIYARI